MHDRRWRTAVATLLVSLLRAAVATAGGIDDPVPVCGDVNDNGSVTSSDALLVLKNAVGQPVTLDCQDCPKVVVYGEIDELSESSQHAPNVLLGTQLHIPKRTAITHLGVIGKVSGPHVQLGLYTDNGGAPDTLVASTTVHQLDTGEQWYSVAAAEVPAGDYWLMGTYDAQASIGFKDTGVSTVVKYRDLMFTGSLPTTFGPAFTYSGQKFNYYLHGIQ